MGRYFAITSSDTAILSSTSDRPFPTCPCLRDVYMAYTGGGDADEVIGPDKVSSKFAEKLSGLRETLSSILSEPHRFGGQPVLGGPVLVSLLSEVCERVNQGAKDIVPLR